MISRSGNDLSGGFFRNNEQIFSESPFQTAPEGEDDFIERNQKEFLNRRWNGFDVGEIPERVGPFSYDVAARGGYHLTPDVRLEQGNMGGILQHGGSHRSGC